MKRGTSKKNIILIGYRASGKSSIGKLLARHLNKQFIDVDEQIIKHYDGLNIAQIWKQYGEKSFRKTESKVVEELCQKQNVVIALGGGSLIDSNSAKAIKQMDNTLRVYLYCDPDLLNKRIHADSNNAINRPSLTTHRGNLKEIKKVLTQREPIYRQVADITFDTTNIPSVEKATKLLEVKTSVSYDL